MAEQSTIGAQLQQAREKRGESLEQTHERTGIGVRVLRGLEEDSVDVVELVYLRMALQLYAEYLGLEADELAERFDQEHGTPHTGPPVRPVSLPASGASDLIERLRDIPRTWMIGGAAGVMVIAILLIGYIFSDSTEAPVAPVSRVPEPAVSPAPDRSPATDPQPQNRESTSTPSEQTATSAPVSPGSDALASGSPVVADGPATETPASAQSPGTLSPADRSGLTASASEGPPSGVAETTVAEASVASPSPAAAPPSSAAESTPAEAPITSRAPAVAPATPIAAGSLVLEARAVDSTWVRVQGDGAPPVEEIIPRGQTRRWEAGDHLLVVAGRAHGVQFSFQGELLGEGRLGKPTEILRFRASRDGVYLLGPDLRPTSRVDNPQESSAIAPDAAGP